MSMMASQKQIDLVHKIENVLDIKYVGLYDFGTIDEFIRNNSDKYKDECRSMNYDDREDLYELYDEQF